MDVKSRPVFMKRRIPVLLKESTKEFSVDNGGLLAAAISFNLFFSLIPIVFIVVYISALMPQSHGIQQQIVNGIGYLLPVSRQLITSVESNVTTARSGIGALAFVGAIWGGLSFFNCVRVSLNAVWGLRNLQPILRVQLVNFMMMLAAGALVFLSVWLTVISSTGYAPSIHVPGVGFLGRSLAARALTNILFTALAFLVFLLLYKFIPSMRPKWKDIWVGALVAATAFEILKVIFVWYLRVFHPYNAMFGSLATVTAFLMWTYLSALIFLFMAKITCADIKMRGQTD